MFPQPPWTNIGALQSDVDCLKSELQRKVNSYEVSSLRSTVDRLESSLREISSEVDGLRTRKQEVEMRIQEHIQEEIERRESDAD